MSGIAEPEYLIEYDYIKNTDDILLNDPIISSYTQKIEIPND